MNMNAAEFVGTICLAIGVFNVLLILLVVFCPRIGEEDKE